MSILRPCLSGRLDSVWQRFLSVWRRLMEARDSFHPRGNSLYLIYYLYCLKKYLNILLVLCKPCYHQIVKKVLLEKQNSIDSGSAARFIVPIVNYWIQENCNISKGISLAQPVCRIGKRPCNRKPGFQIHFILMRIQIRILGSV